MQKTILITGATDGIGLAAAGQFAQPGHRVLLHGRNPEKLKAAEQAVSARSADGCVESYLADLSRFGDIEKLATDVADRHSRLDVLINNAGVLKTPRPITADGLDVRFVVNTIAPWLLTQRLLPLLDRRGRVINLSSAAQSSVNLEALKGKRRLSDMDAYAQSKLALTMWSRHMAHEIGDHGPVIVAVNPGSLLATKMVKEAFGSSRSDVSVGAQILVRAALDDTFAAASGNYFDNDAGEFSDPHPDALNARKCRLVIDAMEAALASLEVS